jgi:hypothetical protein
MLNFPNSSKNNTKQITVYFKKPEYWTDARIHFWNLNPAEGKKGTKWPGVKMKPSPKIGRDWYSYTFKNIDGVEIVFCEGIGGKQTENLYIDQDAYYNPDRDGWVSNPSTPLIVHFKKPANWEFAMIHLWNIEPYDSSSYDNSIWPGIEMKPNPTLGEDWYTFRFSEANCANIIFNDGDKNKTDDLVLCGEGWYDEGWIQLSHHPQTKASA